MYQRSQVGINWFEFTLSYILVLTLIITIFVLIKKLYKFPAFKKFVLQDKKIKIIDSINIGARNKIIYIECEGAKIIIGATPNHINLLHVFNNQIVPHDTQNKKINTSFNEYIKMQSNINENSDNENFK